MGETLNRMREAAQRGKASGSQQEQPATGPAPRPQKVKPPVVGTEQVTCACGHPATFELFADKQDKYRDNRRKKVTDRPCSACRQQAAQEHNARAKAEAEARRGPKQQRRALRNDQRNHQQRLPDGAGFHVFYNAASTRWQGSLEIPDAAAEMGFRRFDNDASGVFKLLGKLDAQYREWLAAQTPPIVNATPKA